MALPASVGPKKFRVYWLTGPTFWSAEKAQQGRGMSNQKASQKPARSQPEANQTSFFDSQKPAKPGKQRPDLARQPCRELSFVCAPSTCHSSVPIGKSLATVAACRVPGSLGEDKLLAVPKQCATRTSL